jgi:hypothetical protein
MWEQPLAESERDKLIHRVAKEIIRRRLQTPAILFLEMHKPLSNVAGHAAIAFAPFVMPFLGFKTVDEYSQVFKERENVERLIQLLEESRLEPKEKA